MTRTGQKRGVEIDERPREETSAWHEAAKPVTQRLDKWLWFARLAKTRSLAAKLVEGGKVRVNREKILKPAHNVRCGDVITAALRGGVRVVRITAPGSRRGPACEAQDLYDDMTPPRETPSGANTDTASSPARASGAGRPTKRERRHLDAVRARAANAVDT